ncbi:hypothetical protein [Hyalangium versicolor]|uniref:hypothetical protein n=1 Tax=Hyalangium versicolor TaxID=2861190 RepID=UPI001CCA7475|nr:hypothetical protein [Hyalangium versicolor]
MAALEHSDEVFERKRRFAVMGFLVGLVLSQFGFFALLRAGGFWSGYFLNAVLWTVAFAMWSRLLAPLRTYRGHLNALLFFLVIGGEIGALLLAQGFPDSAYCPLLRDAAREATCFISPKTQDASIFFSFFFIPVSLTTLIVAFMTTLRQPQAHRLEPANPTAMPSGTSTSATSRGSRSTIAPLLIAVGLFLLAFVALLVLVIMNTRPPV